jgi:hypothetical protein
MLKRDYAINFVFHFKPSFYLSGAILKGNSPDCSRSQCSRSSF